MSFGFTTLLLSVVADSFAVELFKTNMGNLLKIANERLLERDLLQDAVIENLRYASISITLSVITNGSMMKKVKDWVCIKVFRLSSLTIAAYFSYVFHSTVGFPPEKELTSSSATYLVISVFFFLLPLAKKLKLGTLLEYEAKVNEIKNDVKEFKEETRQILSMQNALINTVSNTINQNVNINLPGHGEIEVAKEELDNTIKKPTPQNQLEAEIDDFLASEGADLNLVLAKLRMEIEKELRRILIKRLDTEDPTKIKGRFLSVRSLFNKFIKIFPQYSGMYSSFDFILKICNATIHGQNISRWHEHEALQMGFKMLDELKKVDS